MKKIMFLILAVSAFFIVLIYQNNITDNVPVSNSDEIPLYVTKDPQPAPSRLDKKINNADADNENSAQFDESSVINKKDRRLIRTKQEIEEMRAVMEKRELEQSAQSLYSSYSESTLAELAEQGDLMAIKQLHHRVMQEIKDAPRPTGTELTAEYARWQQETVMKMDKYVYEAILYGDRELLGQGARLFQRSLSTGNTEDARATALDELAFYEFTRMRGDVLGGHLRTEGAVRHFERQHGPLQLSDTEKTAIQGRAEQIYNELERKRMDVGLGPFDNTVAEWELKQVEAMRQNTIEVRRIPTDRNSS